MSGFQSFLRGKRVVPSVPQGRAVRTVSYETAIKAPRRDGTSSFALFVEYLDAQGEPSARRIACRSFDPSSQALMAWCFEREAIRQFRVDRIQEAICTETGEVFELGLLLDVLSARGLPVRDTRLARCMMMLIFLMRCDGIHRAEINAIESAATSYALSFDGNDATVEEAMRLSNLLAPDSVDFNKGLRWMTTRSDGAVIARFMRKHAAAVIDADGRHSAEEIRFGAELGDMLTRIAHRV